MSLYDSILIPGGNGMLGQSVTDLLVARGHKPVSLTIDQLDITDETALRKTFAQVKPTLLLNCAAHTLVDLCEQEPAKADLINGHAVGMMADLCRAAGTVMAHVSTDFVFDGAKRRPYAVDDPVNPLNAYGRSKLLGETLLRKNAPPRWLMVRTAWVFGRQGANFPRTMVQAARAGKPLTVVNDQWGAPTYAPDLAETILALLDSGAGGVWHATNSGQTTWFEFAAAALQEFAVEAAITPISSAEWTQKRPASAIRPGYSVLDLAPLERQLGRPQRPWRQALADYRRAVDHLGF